jgi:hypothetical protein
VLYEAASGYALFEALDADEIAQNSERVQEAIACVPSRRACALRRNHSRARCPAAVTWRASASCCL